MTSPDVNKGRWQPKENMCYKSKEKEKPEEKRRERGRRE